MDKIAQRLAALFAFGLLALFPPFLGAFNRPGSLFGLPILPLYLFAIWGVLVLVAWALTRGGRS